MLSKFVIAAIAFNSGYFLLAFLSI